MSEIEVFNPASSPVYVDDARVIPGSEWATVKNTSTVRLLIASKALLSKPQDPVLSPVQEVTNEEVADEAVEPADTDTEEVVVANDSEVPSEVSSDVEHNEVIDTDNPQQPASMKRRRKTSPPTKE